MPHNRRPGLLPRAAATGWRGSTLGTTSLVAGGGPPAYDRIYGHHLHLWRVFKTPDTAALTAEERAFVASGGILWFNMQPANWSAAASPAFAPTLAAYASAVRLLAPAQVIVNAGHEPDGHCDPDNGKPYYGSPAESMWGAFRAAFAAAGANNTVWAMDYSRSIRKQQTFDRFAAALWPGDGMVDWLPFNAFGDHPIHDTRGNWAAIVGTIYDRLEANAAPGHNWTAVPAWGVGAFQPKPPPTMSAGDRQGFVLQAAAALDAARFPRLRAMVYYDHSAAGMPAAYRQAYEKYLSSSYFTANDAEHYQ